MNLVIKIALGIILAFSILGISVSLIEMYAIQEMNESLQRKALLEQAKIKKQQEAKLREKESQRLFAIKEQQKKEKAQRLAWRKQQTWYTWYKENEPEGCDNWQSDRHMVECINKKMDLKSEFEKVWHSQHSLSQK